MHQESAFSRLALRCRFVSTCLCMALGTSLIGCSGAEEDAENANNAKGGTKATSNAQTPLDDQGKKPVDGNDQQPGPDGDTGPQLVTDPEKALQRGGTLPTGQGGGPRKSDTKEVTPKTGGDDKKEDATRPQAKTDPKLESERKKWTGIANDINDMKQIALAFHNYHEVYLSFLPARENQPQYFDENGKLKLSWRVHLLPFLDQIALYEQFNLDEPWDSDNNKPLLEKMPEVYRTEGDSDNKTRYLGFSDSRKPDGNTLSSLFPTNGRAVRIRDILDGTSNTILFVKAPKDKAVDWTKPEDFAFDSSKPAETVKAFAKEELGIAMAISDGSVLVVKPEINAETFANLINPQDGNVVSDLTDLRVRLRNPMEFVKPKTGPVHLAYMHPRALAAIVIHPKKIFETKWVADLIDDDFAETALKAEGMDIRKIDEVVVWVTADNPFSPAYFAMTSTDKATFQALQDAPKPMEMFLHDEDTVIFADEAIMQDILGDMEENKQLAGLMGKAVPADQLAAVVSMKHPTILQFTNPALLGQLPLPPNLADERVLGVVPKIQSVRFTLNLDKSTMKELTFNLADAEAAGIIREFLTNGLATAKQQLELAPAEATEAVLAKAILGQLSVDSNDTEVVVSLKADDKVKEQLGAAVKKAMNEARVARDRAIKMNNLKQVGLAFHNYHDTYGRFAPGDNPDWLDDKGKSKLSWRVHILPFIEEAALYQEFRLNEPWDSDHNKKLLEKMPAIFKTEGVTKAGHTSLVTFSGEDTPFDGGPGPRLVDVTDGSSNTLLVVEAGADKAVPWTKPADLEIDWDKPLESLGKIGETFQALFMDGSVRVFSDTIDPEELKGLITPSAAD